MKCYAWTNGDIICFWKEFFLVLFLISWHHSLVMTVTTMVWHCLHLIIIARAPALPHYTTCLLVYKFPPFLLLQRMMFQLYFIMWRYWQKWFAKILWDLLQSKKHKQGHIACNQLNFMHPAPYRRSLHQDDDMSN